MFCYLRFTQVRGFPTIKIFRKGDEPEDYQGGRTRSDIVARAMDLFSDNIPAPEIQEVFSLYIFFFLHFEHLLELLL